ncbi:hypothetical protein J2X72_004363 [Phyllobacterium sp. 1468]|nr:hypothetical protein [Phyllobacterium sp. 1468]
MRAPLLVSDILNILESLLMGGNVYENVNPIKLTYGAVDSQMTMLGGLDITRDQHRFSASLFGEPFGLSDILIAISDQDICTLASIRDNHGAADPAVPASDDRFLAFQPPGSLIGLHIVRKAWDGLPL